jgi:hypothetical protein
MNDIKNTPVYIYQGVFVKLLRTENNMVIIQDPELGVLKVFKPNFERDSVKLSDE